MTCPDSSYIHSSPEISFKKATGSNIDVQGILELEKVMKLICFLSDLTAGSI
jgi:hypothetical protein